LNTVYSVYDDDVVYRFIIFFIFQHTTFIGVSTRFQIHVVSKLAEI
jgi:hypothetical protein